MQLKKNDTTDNRIVSKTIFLDFVLIIYSYISIHMTRQNFFCELVIHDTKRQ